MIAMRKILTTLVPSLADTKKKGSLFLAAKLKDLDVTCRHRVALAFQQIYHLQGRAPGVHQVNLLALGSCDSQQAIAYATHLLGADPPSSLSSAPQLLICP
jgi:hypothetical protein